MFTNKGLVCSKQFYKQPGCPPYHPFRGSGPFGTIRLIDICH